MKNKKIFAAFVGTGLALSLGLSACGNETTQSTEQSGTQSGTPSTNSAEIPDVDRDPKGPLPEIEGAFGDMPTMTPVTGDAPSQISVKILEKGDGEEVQADDFVTVNYAGFLWDGTAFEDSFGNPSPAAFSLNQVIAGWKYGLPGTHVGDRIEIVIPSQYAYGEAGTASIPANSDLVFVVDMLAAMPVTTDELKSAELTNAELPAGLTVAGELGEEPQLAFASDATAPTEGAVIVLAEGTGPIATDVDTVFYHIAGNQWGSPAARSTWSEGPQQENAAGGLAGYKVGSRLLFLQPADGTNPASAVVVDMLALYTPEIENAQSK